LVLAQELNVGDEMIGGIGGEVGVGHAGQWTTTATSALVEQNDAIFLGIKEASLVCGAT
jgi:hypothetical protein